jgi:hypothetical protein
VVWLWTITTVLLAEKGMLLLHDLEMVVLGLA